MSGEQERKGGGEWNHAEEGRDELNLAEFPLCSLAHRLRPGQKTLTFEDQIWDQSTQETVTRRLVVSAADAYGLPTPLDDEVLLGLIQLTKLARFASRTVPFTRYQLLRLLRWRDESKSYRRLEDSLNRWTGVTLYYTNAWWDRSRKRWVDEKFHVLDNVRLYRRARHGVERGGNAASMFVWNEVIFRSFQAGNMKSLDFEFYIGLEGVVAKRLYRFLDKRFWRKRRWEFDLKEFAWEHAGLSRGYDASDLKRHLRSAIAELESKGFLKPALEADRYRKICSGRWQVRFEAGIDRPKVGVASESPRSEVEQTLITRGVSVEIARRVLQGRDPQGVRRQVEVFDYLVARHDPRVSKNPPGFLVSAIRGDYAVPQDFLQSEEAKARDAKKLKEKANADRRRQARETELQAREDATRQAILDFWKCVSPPERDRMEGEALANATPLQRQLLERGGSGGKATREALLEAYAKLRLTPATGAAADRT